MSLSTVLAQADTIPDDSGGPYVVAAYLVFLVLVVIYLAIMAQRLRKVSKQADDIEARLDRQDAARAADAGSSMGSTPAGAAAEGSASAKTREGVA